MLFLSPLERRTSTDPRSEGDSISPTEEVPFRKEGLQVSEDHRPRSVWRGGPGSETGYWTCVCHEDTEEGGHVGEGAGKVGRDFLSVN